MVGDTQSCAFEVVVDSDGCRDCRADLGHERDGDGAYGMLPVDGSRDGCILFMGSFPGAPPHSKTRRALHGDSHPADFLSGDLVSV